MGWGTLKRETDQGSDGILFESRSDLLGGGAILILGIAFAIGGSWVLQDAAAHTPSIQAAHRAALPAGGRLPHPDSTFSDWAFAAVLLGVGGLLAVAGLYHAWTFRSLIIRPGKRELVRKIALRWPRWTFTRAWQTSDIDRVYLDEYVTVWPGTPKGFEFLGTVEPEEVSEGHVWICIRWGMGVDFGRGGWEEATSLASRLADLLGAPKSLRARYHVGAPPSSSDGGL